MSIRQPRVYRPHRHLDRKRQQERDENQLLRAQAERLRDELQAAVADVASSESVYALGQDEYDAIRDPGFQGSNVNYLSDDTAYQTPEAAMKSLDAGKRCRYDSRTAHMICSGR